MVRATPQILLPGVLATAGPPPLAEHLPAVLSEVGAFGLAAWQWIGLGVLLLFAALVGLGVGALLRRLALRLARRTRVTWDDDLVVAASGPGRLLLFLATFAVAVKTLRLPPAARETVEDLLAVAAVVALTWAALRAITFLSDTMDRRFAAEAPDALSARGARTQIMVLKRVAGVIVVILGGALVLLQFDALRSIGTSLLASAGVAGIVVGLAAQRSIATLLAGIQLSITQPIRIGDVIIVEGEWGTVEEITLTYVVMRIWDQRRLIVPITHFLDAPFQNWTKVAPDLLGTVFVYADYTVPVDRLREEVASFVKTRPEWDGRVTGLVMTDVTERTVQLRALVSAADSGRAWDLRCALREHLVAFLRELDGGAYLPRTRLTSGEASGAAAPGR